MVCKQINVVLIFSVTLVSCHVDQIVLVHGGADNVHDLRVDDRKESVKQAAMNGYKILKKGGSVVDAVEQAIRTMEAHDNFNAGIGSSLNIDGEVEMDASIMVGSNLSSGAVTCVKNVAHPVSLARMVMENSPYFLLAGDGARRFAISQGVQLVSNNALITPQSKEDFAEYMKTAVRGKGNVNYATGCGGVGAIAVDAKGHVAAASSSGGRIGKLPGRTGDSAIVGAGIYATDDIGAVVVTGHGEAIARYVMAHEIINLMKRGFEVGVATRNAVKGITEKFHKPTGAIAVSKNGQVGISFTTDKMAWAYQLRDDVHYGVDDYDHFSEKIKI